MDGDAHRVALCRLAPASRATRVRGTRAVVALVVAVAAAAWCPAACAAAPAGSNQADTFTGEVVAVHDGDTISVRTDRSTVRIRLVGIDCPETGQPWSARAKRFTSELVFGRIVRVESRGLDRYDRVLGRVLVNGTDVNEALVRAGLAWQYDLGPQDPALTRAERAARQVRAGLWSDPDPIPPWRWRREHPRER
jgi:endonuclease YncB( thermonuclease family)